MLLTLSEKSIAAEYLIIAYAINQRKILEKFD